MNRDFTLVAPCAAGLEKLTAAEIEDWGGSLLETVPGMVRFQGRLSTAYGICLWSRFASRVLLQIASSRIADSDALYRGIREISWQDHLGENDTLAVSATLGRKAVIDHSHYAALRVKDGIVDAFREAGMRRPNVAKKRPDVKIHLHVEDDLASVYIDLSGESLHRRGYRRTTGAAPLKETLAAAVVSLAGWSRDVAPSEVFVDPMCGSATLLIEAALIWGDTAPGLSRKYYGFTGWRGHDDVLWTQLVDDALAREEARQSVQWPAFVGIDNDPEVVAAARQNIENAGLEDRIEIGCREIGLLQPPAASGYLVSNMPYGERLSEKEEVRCLYGCIGNMLKRRFGNYRAGLLLADPDAADQLSLNVEARHRLYNGPLACRLIVGRRESTTKPFRWRLADTDISGEGADFANRLKKKFKKLNSWAEQNGFGCYRLYERDIPEYNFIVDIYERWIFVQEYAPPATVDAELARLRFSTALSVLRELFQAGRDRLFIRRRSRQKGASQYQKRQGKEKYYQVSEKECIYLVNFTNYLDTGLFLDHRPLRQKIAAQARGRRFLNLFCYTGTASVQAARGGAAQTMMVDLSAKYIGWAKKNLALNGFTGGRHQTAVSDCLTWLREAKGQYDIILVDPPTFSNTKKKKRTFDVQRDHAELIRQSMRLLAEGGVLYFSTNFRKFKLDPVLAEQFQVDDITLETIPVDFGRNPPPHRCFEFRAEKAARSSE